jgi:3-isopropylmalate/(R)-2-methylmalate dehydratase large subunit
MAIEKRRPQTLTEKIIARAAGIGSVAPGDLVTVKIDLAMAHDSSGPRRWRPHLEALGVGLWDPDRVVIVSDHYVPAVDSASAEILRGVRKFVADYHVRHFYDMQGICHAILPEHGHLKPGMLAAGGDSHSPMGGAFGCYMCGFGATDMVGIVVTGETWMDVPETIRIDWSGSFGPGVAAKDMMLYLCRELGMDNAGRVVEYGGPTVAAMAMEERMVLCNMAAELGADSGIVAPDEKTLDHIRAHGGSVEDDALSWQSDPDAPCLAAYSFDASGLAPQVAAPHSPANSAPAGDFAGTRIDQAYIGACVGAKLDDLTMAAEVLRGRKVAAGVRLLVAPASTQVTHAATANGVMETLLDAGAILMPSGCGACAGMGAGLLASGEVCISTTNRNFKGRMGDPGSFVYLANPYSVAAAAVAGQVVDPREMLADIGGRL